MSEKNETVEKQEIKFDFTVEGMEIDTAKSLMDVISYFLDLSGLELGGGFYPYKDEPDPREVVVEAAKKLLYVEPMVYGKNRAVCIACDNPDGIDIHLDNCPWQGLMDALEASDDGR